MKYINAAGKQCPMPVVMAKKEIDAGEKDLVVAVDNPIAVENLKRLASKSEYTYVVREKGDIFEVHLKGTECADGGCEVMTFENNKDDYVMFFGKDYVGDGEYELGHNLIKMMIYALSEGESIPSAILFMNSGVKLPAGDEEQIIENLKTLLEKGTEILVCGTCLNYYGITEKLKVGTVSNMYDILEKMQGAKKVITV